MAWFTVKEWKNRLAEFAGRRTLTNVSTGTSQVVDVARNEGTISQEGDAFSAANMNDFEQRILEGFNKAESANNELNKNMGGNILTYNESEDAYYIQYGADSVPKKLGEPKTATATFKNTDTSTTTSATQTFNAAKSGYKLIGAALTSARAFHGNQNSDTVFKVSVSGNTITLKITANGASFRAYADYCTITAYYVSV